MPRCKCCKDKFESKHFNQKFCLVKGKCLLSQVEYSKEMQRKAWRKDKKKRKEALKTRGDYLNELQTLVNRYTRLRDKGQPCISCGTTKQTIKYDAGHYYSVGAYPNMRFKLDNIHRQCYKCNRELSGNPIEYRPRLIEKIGVVRFNHLDKIKNEPLKLSIEEIQDQKKIFRAKIKEIKLAC